MIVERLTFKVKVGCRAKFIELTKAVVEEAGMTSRVFSYRFGPHDIVISDLEFESMEDHRKFWDDLDWSQPKAAEWYKKEADLTESGQTNELLNLH